MLTAKRIKMDLSKGNQLNECLNDPSASNGQTVEAETLENCGGSATKSKSTHQRGTKLYFRSSYHIVCAFIYIDESKQARPRAYRREQLARTARLIS